MSTSIAFTSAHEDDASQDDGRGSGILNHILLFVEMFSMSLFVAGTIILSFHMAYPHSHTHLGKHFGFLAGSSVFTLFCSVLATIQKLETHGRAWHLLFHVPFFVAMLILGRTALQESSPTSVLPGIPGIILPAVSFMLGIPLVHVILDKFYMNMTAALEGKDGAGLLFLGYPCRWTKRLTSAFRSCHPASAQSFEIGRHLGNVKKWFSNSVPSTQHVRAWPNEETEESKTLLRHEDDLV